MTRRSFGFLRGFGSALTLFPGISPYAQILATKTTELFCREFFEPDSKLTAFTLSYSPISNLRVNVFRNGLLQREGGDYTLSAKTLVFPQAPVAGDLLEVQYYGQFTV